ncbi:MAG: cyclic nucleotide-binding domain-containing protein [Bdellovibrionales bacterium]|nr:cyclic nucleotide-binding domain-containing protein [Bdellovibrionales bacterium]
MENVKKLKRGEQLFKEGEPITHVYMIQSGKVALMSERGGKGIEVQASGAGSVLGEHALFMNGKHEFSGEALQEVKVLEVPIELMKQQFEKCPPGMKILIKSVGEELRNARKQMKMQKLETERVPCPQGVIHRMFTIVHLIARHIGKKKADNPNEVTVAWDALKLYSSRFFGESPQRLRSLMDLLLKIKFAEFTVRKTEEGEEELSDVRLADVQLLEDFAEFYQYHLFKGSKAEAIYVDLLALKVAKAFGELSAGAEVDHKGASRLDWTVVLAECKAKYRFELKNTHLDSLERKGLFVKRQSFDDGRMQVSFDRNEFVKMAHYWSIIAEIDKWNEHGFVNLHEKEEVVGPEGAACPTCSGVIDDKHKFCPHCGAKLNPTAA